MYHFVAFAQYQCKCLEKVDLAKAEEDKKTQQAGWTIETIEEVYGYPWSSFGSGAVSAPGKTKVANVTPKRTARLFSKWPQALLNGLDELLVSVVLVCLGNVSWEALSSFIQPIAHSPLSLCSWEGMSNQVRLQLCAEDHVRDGHPTSSIRRCVEVETHSPGAS